MMPCHINLHDSEKASAECAVFVSHWSTCVSATKTGTCMGCKLLGESLVQLPEVVPPLSG